MTETVPHFLFSCPRWKDERQAMKSAHASRYWDVSYALGGYSTAEREGKKVDGEKDKWQLDLDAVKATIEYAIKTGRLQRQTRSIKRQDEPYRLAQSALHPTTTTRPPP
jgi:hypothetical protein